MEKFKNEGGNIIIGTPGRIEDLLMGKTDSSHKNLFVQAMKSLVSILFAKKLKSNSSKIFKVNFSKIFQKLLKLRYFMKPAKKIFSLPWRENKI